MAWQFFDSTGALRTTDPFGRGVVYSPTPPSRTDVIWIDTSTTGYIETVSVLPSSPYDGQIIDLQTAAMATDGIVWRFKYRAGSASAYKWEFVGGPAWVNTGGGGNVSTGGATTYGDPAGGTGSVTIPAAGDYCVEYTARSENNSSGNSSEGYAGITKSGTVQVNNYYLNGTVLNKGAACAGATRLNGLSASDVLKFQAGTAGGINTNFFYPTVRVTPVRIG